MTDTVDDPRRAILERINAAGPTQAPRIEPPSQADQRRPHRRARAVSSNEEDAQSSQMGVVPVEGSENDAPATEQGIGVGGDETDWDFECAKLPLTDLGNAQRFVLRHGDGFLYVAEWGWLAWDGKRWSRDRADGLLNRAIHATIFAIGSEAQAWADSGEDEQVDEKKGKRIYYSDRISGWGMTSQGAAHVGCIERLARSYIEAHVDDFDADPMLLNVANGTLRFRLDPDGGDTVTFRAHDRGDRITKISPVLYDPDAVCPVYDAALAKVQPDGQMVRHLHCWGGISITGDVSVQRMAFWYGKGRNMKSTLLNAWAHVAGDYSTTIAAESFIDQGRTRRGGEPTPDLAKLQARRFLITSEPERGAKLAEGLIKTVTGEERISVRELNKPFFELKLQFTLTMFGNSKPRIDGTDDGIWRRVVFVPWERQVPEGEVDFDLPVKLKAEASGILNRLLDGVRDFLDNGLVLPETITEATSDFRIESDPLGRFLEVCVGRRENGRVQSTELHNLYYAWCMANGEKPWTPNGFGRALAERGFRKIKSSVAFWIDVELIKAVHDFVDFGDGDKKTWRVKAPEKDRPADDDTDSEML